MHKISYVVIGSPLGIFSQVLEPVEEAWPQVKSEGPLSPGLEKSPRILECQQLVVHAVEAVDRDYLVDGAVPNLQGKTERGRDGMYSWGLYDTHAKVAYTI